MSEIQEKTNPINEAVAKLSHFVNLFQIESIFISGSYCRELYLGNNLDTITKLDVISAYPHQAQELGGLFASEILELPVIYSDDTAMIDYNGIKIQFQGQSTNKYMYNQEVREWLHSNEIDDIPLMHNLFGRDFTMNALVYSLKTGHMLDPIKRCVKDIERERIVSLLPAHILVKNNPISILRALRFSLLYGFDIDAALEESIRSGFYLLYETLPKERIVKEIVRILKIDGPDALRLLKRFDLDKVLLDKKIRDYLDVSKQTSG